MKPHAHTLTPAHDERYQGLQAPRAKRRGTQAPPQRPQQPMWQCPCRCHSRECAAADERADLARSLCSRTPTRPPPRPLNVTGGSKHRMWSAEARKHHRSSHSSPCGSAHADPRAGTRKLPCCCSTASSSCCRACTAVSRRMPACAPSCSDATDARSDLHTLSSCPGQLATPPAAISGLRWQGLPAAREHRRHHGFLFGTVNSHWHSLAQMHEVITLHLLEFGACCACFLPRLLRLSSRSRGN